MIRIIAVGKLREDYASRGVSMFLRRLSRFAKVGVIEIKDSSISEEGEEILNALGEDYAIILDVRGRRMSSEEFSAFLKNNMERNVSFVIGGPEGISDAVKERANYSLSLSDMTLAHEMARLVLAEQIYRAYTIMKGIKYHK